MAKGNKEEKRKLQLMVSAEFYDWFKKEATKRGLEDRLGRFLEMFINELQENKARDGDKIS